MTKRIIFLSPLLLCAIQQCSSMETQQLSTKNIVPFHHGLLTEIEAQIVRTSPKGWVSDRTISKIITKTDTLQHLMQYRKKLDNAREGAYELFCPLLLKEESNGSLKKLGQYNYDDHKEAKEAMRFNQALYCPIQQGVLIYHLNRQPQIKLVLDHQDSIMTLLEEHSQKICIPSKYPFTQ